jgi:hypothetical protein
LNLACVMQWVQSANRTLVVSVELKAFMASRWSAERCGADPIGSHHRQLRCTSVA